MCKSEKKVEPDDGTAGHVARQRFHDDARRDFALQVTVSLSVLSFQIPDFSDNQGRRERNDYL